VGAAIAAVLVAVGTGAGVLIGQATSAGSNVGPVSSVTGGQIGGQTGGQTGAAAVASKVSPGLVDINVTLGYQQANAAGTGMVLTSSGEVLTNNHVVEGATSIQVTDIGNGKTYDANVVGYDRSVDVAVLQLVGASGLSTVTLGNSSAVQTGDSVVAVGNAGGTGGTPSYAAGSVTAVNQSIVASDQSGGPSQQLTGLIATDANVVAGDSGGPLVDSAGQVIGMDTAGSVSNSGQPGGGQLGGGRFGGGQAGGGQFGGGQFGGGQFGGGQAGGGQTSGGQTGGGQGYAIPIDQAASIAGQIEAGSSSSTVHIGATAFLGVGVADGSNGALITSVLSGGAAAQAGLTTGDTITSLDGQAVTAGRSLTDLMLTERPGKTVQVQYLDSSGIQHTTSVQLASGPPQ
jgi:S1-C subfamily serine protease